MVKWGKAVAIVGRCVSGGTRRRHRLRNSAQNGAIEENPALKAVVSSATPEDVIQAIERGPPSALLYTAAVQQCGVLHQDGFATLQKVLHSARENDVHLPAGSAGVLARVLVHLGHPGKVHEMWQSGGLREDSAMVGVCMIAAAMLGEARWAQEIWEHAGQLQILVAKNAQVDDPREMLLSQYVAALIRGGLSAPLVAGALEEARRDYGIRLTDQTVPYLVHHARGNLRHLRVLRKLATVNLVVCGPEGLGALAWELLRVGSTAEALDVAAHSEAKGLSAACACVEAHLVLARGGDRRHLQLAKEAVREAEALGASDEWLAVVRKVLTSV